MATKTENTAAAPATLHPDEQDKYAPVNLILYRTSLSLYQHLREDGKLSDGSYRKIRCILNKRYGLPPNSIFAESA